MSSGVRRLWCGMRTIGAVGYIALISVSPALSLPYIPKDNNQTFISDYWGANDTASPYYSLGSDSEYNLSCTSINAHNVRWLPGTDGILQKETDSIEALYRFSINNENVNGGFYQYDANNNVYGTAPNGWAASGTALTAATIESCYGLKSGGITRACGHSS